MLRNGRWADVITLFNYNVLESKSTLGSVQSLAKVSFIRNAYIFIKIMEMSQMKNCIIYCICNSIL